MPKTNKNEVEPSVPQYETIFNGISAQLAELSNHELIALVNKMLALNGLTLQPRINIVVLDKEGKQL